MGHETSNMALVVTILALLAGSVHCQTKCDAYGTSATYSETIGTTSGVASRTISSNGCPNHYSLCTGKDGVPGCGDVGETGSATEAKVQTISVVIPASPVLRATISLTDTNNGGIKCEMGAIGIALNGVAIYGGAVDTSCTGIDVDSTLGEWKGFDCCSGHSQRTGDYHYHFPPSCLLKQIGDLSDGHSPQVGWAYDGFPIYGPKGPGGVTMKYSSAACTAAGTSGCTGTGTYVLDMCGGYEGEISGLDTFKYRYYFTGATSDLSVLPSNPRPSADAAPIFAFSMNCQRGFTSTELQSGSTGTTGVTTSYSAAANAGKAEQYAPTGLCSAGSYTAPGTAGFCDDTTTSSCNAAWTAITTTTSTTSAPTTANLGTRATCSFFLMLVATLAACFF